VKRKGNVACAQKKTTLCSHFSGKKKKGITGHLRKSGEGGGKVESAGQSHNDMSCPVAWKIEKY